MSHNDLATQASTLGDRSHQKRELAAISVEMTVRQIMSSDLSHGIGGSIHGHHHHGISSMNNVLNQNRNAAEIIYRRTDQIQKVINFLMTNYIDSEQANYRKGGLLGLAGVIMALTTKRNTLTYEGITFLNQVIPIIQKCLDDKDPSVRYYANETLFNVIKVSRYHIILFFDLIFSQIQILCDDQDELVRESNKCVNRLLQDVACNYDHFKLKPFINILQNLIRSKSQRVRILALNWMQALDAQPDIYFLVYLHHFINPLFALIVDHRPSPSHVPVPVPVPISNIGPTNYNDQSMSPQAPTGVGVSGVSGVASVSGVHPHHHQVHRRHHRKIPKDTQMTQELMSDLLQEISEYLQRDQNDIHESEKFDINQIVKDLVVIITTNNNDLQVILNNNNNNIYNDNNNDNNNTTANDNDGEPDHDKITKNNDIDDDESSELEFDAILDYKIVNKINKIKVDTDTSSDDGNDQTILTAHNQQQTDNNNTSGTAPGSKELGNATQKIVALQWLDTFINLGGHRLKKLYPSILRAILCAMNDPRIQSTAVLLNDHLMNLVLNLDDNDDDIVLNNDDNDDNNDDNDIVDDIMDELKQDDGVISDISAGDDDNINDNDDVVDVVHSKYDSFDIDSVMNILIDVLHNSRGDISLSCTICTFSWISSLLVDLPFNYIPHNKLLSVCFIRLCDSDNINNSHILHLQSIVMNMNLEVLARLSLHPTIFSQLLTRLLSLFYENTQSLLLKKGKLIITKLCELLDCTQIYCLLSTALINNKLYQNKYAFLRNIVRLMNLILLTSSELYPLREIISKSRDNKIFNILYATWCYSPVSLLSLCLLAKRYDLGLMLINKFLEDIFIHKSVQFLLEIDELVHLIESPIFLSLRLELLCLDDDNNNNNIDKSKWMKLFQIVNGLLTLLPNSDAFHQFRIRIQMISQYKRLFQTLSFKSNNPSLLNDKVLHDAMYFDHNNNNNNINASDTNKLFKQYIDSQPDKMHSSL